MIRAVFMGTAPLACPSLQALFDSGLVKIEGVVTQPDKPKGRNLQLTPSPVKELALQLGLTVHQPLKARTPEFIATLAGLAPEIIVVVAYGQILPRGILEIPRFGCLNVHTSLLPRHRGAAPIQWSLIEGDAETGVTIMRMDEGLDTGPVLSQCRTPITDADDSQVLHDRLAQLGADLLVKTIPGVIDGSIQSLAQDNSLSSYARKISKEDGRIAWDRPAKHLWHLSRGFSPWPGLFTRVSTGGGSFSIKVWKCWPLAGNVDSSNVPGTVLKASAEGLDVSCGEGALRILEVQKEGGRRMAIGEFLAGHRILPGTLLGT